MKTIEQAIASIREVAAEIEPHVQANDLDELWHRMWAKLIGACNDIEQHSNKATPHAHCIGYPDCEAQLERPSVRQLNHAADWLEQREFHKGDHWGCCADANKVAEYLRALAADTPKGMP